MPPKNKGNKNRDNAGAQGFQQQQGNSGQQRRNDQSQRGGGGQNQNWRQGNESNQTQQQTRPRQQTQGNRPRQQRHDNQPQQHEKRQDEADQSQKRDNFPTLGENSQRSQVTESHISQPKKTWGKIQTPVEQPSLPLQSASQQMPPQTTDKVLQVQKSMEKIKVTDDETTASKEITLDILKKPMRKVPNKAGTLGTKISVLANMLEIKFGNRFPKKIVHYDVKMDPERPKYLMRKVFEKARLALFKDRYPAYDGKCNAYSASELPIKDPHTVEVTVADDDNKPITFKVTFQIANYNIDASWLKRCKAGLKDSERDLTSLQAVNTILSCAPILQGISVGRSYFTPKCQRQGFIENLGGGMECWVGLFQSAVIGWKPFLNVDVAHKGFPKKQYVYDAILEVLNENRRYNDPPIKSISADDIFNNKKNIMNLLKGLRVTTIVNGEKRARQVINDIIKDNAKQDFFELIKEKKPDGKNDTAKISVFTYYKDIKKYTIRYPDLPLLWIGKREKNIHVPLEICEIEFGQGIRKKLNDKQTANMVKFAAQGTDIRQDKILSQLATLRHNDDPHIKNEFDISINNEFELVPARILEPPRINYKNGNAFVQRGVWNTKGFDDPTNLIKNDKSWTIVNFSRCEDRDLEKFKNMFRAEGNKMGISIGEPIRPYVQARINFDRNNQRIDLRPITENFQYLKQQGAAFIFVVFQDNIQNCYEIIKQVSELRVGILTQCIKSMTIQRKLTPATINNIVQKVNAKLRGSNHFIDLSFIRPKILQQPVIILGADVTHPSPDSQDIPSIAAVVASHDPKAYKYNTELRLQDPREEIIVDLKNIMIKQLKYFREQTNFIPSQIIFYRDGVSEGQFNEVLRRELTAIRQACGSLNPNYKPAITFLVVQKRHHIRLFPTQERDSDDSRKNFNVKAGTIVDTVITHPTDIDFYLVSHASIQGTARPTKYRVLWDDANLNEDQIEQLTYYLCHMFTRCARSVSYPAPTYYAHLAAFRARALTKDVPINLKKLPEEQEKIKVKPNVLDNAPMFFV